MPTMNMFLTPRQLVALYIYFEQHEWTGFPELSEIQGNLFKELCKHLSIAQFEQIYSLYEAGYTFEEIKK